MQSNIAYIFPAFTLKYKGKEVDILDKQGYPLLSLLQKAYEITGSDLVKFNIEENNFVEDELRNQYMSYIFSCAFSEILNRTSTKPQFVGGFSMGIYAALYHTKAVDFESGLKLVQNVYRKVKDILRGESYAMASVIGFTKTDLESYLAKFPNLECVIQNGIHSFVISGPVSEVDDAMVFFAQEGAMHLSKFTVSCPYHSKILRPYKAEFENLVSSFTFNNPSTELISFIDNSSLNTSADVRNEIAKNVISPLSFYNTISFLANNCIDEFVEVGAGDSLTKSSKFIEGNFKFKPFAKGKVI